MVELANEHFVTAIEKDNEATCWGCGLPLLLPSYTPTFKCGWCGAITNQNVRKHGNKWFWCRRLRDRCFVFILLVFVLFVICGGVWAVYPYLFSVSYLYGTLHLIITFILSVSTISTFCFAAFRCPGTPPSIIWGSYPHVRKGDLDNYTFCHSCSKPKSPRTHHCSSCGLCVLDMDHHCPFIGNCVGSANHRYFIAFLISAVVSTIYVAIMSTTTGVHIWPPLNHEYLSHVKRGFGTQYALTLLRETIVALLDSAELVSARGLLLIYLFVASISVNIGLSILLWQQLSFIYEGKTYLSHLSTGGGGEKDCRNILRFLGCPYAVSRYLPVVQHSPKSHKK